MNQRTVRDGYQREASARGIDEASAPPPRWRKIRLAGAGALFAVSTVAVGLSTQTPALALAGAITGTVYQDYNSNGSKDTTVAAGVAVDTGVSGVKVRAYDAAGTMYGPATTIANGSYTIPGVPTGTNVRIEFEVPSTDPALALLKPSFGATSGATTSTLGTSVQFAKEGDVGVDLAVISPGDYCQNNPLLVTCAMQKGDQTTKEGILTFTSAMTNVAPGVSITTETTQAAQSAVWGVGTDRSRNVFLGTYVKRHIGYGPSGATLTVYKYNVDTNTAPSAFVTFPGTLPAHDATASGGIPWFNDNNPAYSAALTTLGAGGSVYYNVGRVGIGDVDVSDDGKTLYAINMNEAAPLLYTVPINGSGAAVTAGTAASAAITSPCSAGTPTRKWHPMALGLRAGRIFVGGVCSPDGGNNPTIATFPASLVTAHVLEYSGGSFTPVFQTSMDYGRGCSFTGDSTTTCANASDQYTAGTAEWGVWNERTTGVGNFSGNAQPMLSNIEMDDNGELILSFRDRFNDQSGNNLPLPGQTDQLHPIADGEILRACPTTASGLASTAWTIETNGVCGGVTGAGAASKGQGPTSNGQLVHGEFYADDWTSDTGAKHHETSQGASALLPGGTGVYQTGIDPYDTRVWKQGVRYFNESGARTAGQELTPPGAPVDLWSNVNLFAKGNGLADLELMCDMAPLQIGNRVWKDADGDGIQDPGELPAVGVTVRLYAANGTTLLGTAVTNADGEYYFSSNLTDTLLTDHLGGGLPIGAATVIKLDNVANYATGGPIAGMVVTTLDATATPADVIDDAADSDATTVATFAQISVPALTAGNNNHTYDVGFQLPPYDLALVKVATTASVAANGDDISYTIRVQNQGGQNSGPFTVADDVATGTTFNGGSATYAVGGTGQTAIGSPTPTVASGVVSFAFTNAAGLIPGGYVDITFTVNADDVTKAPFRNWAEITVDSGNDEDSVPDTDTGSDATVPNDSYVAIDSLALASTDNVTGDGTGTATGDDNDDAIVTGPAPKYDLQIVKTVTSAGPYEPGSPVTYSLTVTNNGPATASAGWSVTDLLPDGLSYGSPAATSTSATCAAASGNSVTCTGTGPLASGATATITVNAVVNTAGSGGGGTATGVTGNPFEGSAGFTVVSEGDARFGNAETEGSIAVGGNISFAGSYPIIHTSGLTPSDYDIPVIGGSPTRLLVDGTYTPATSGGISEASSRGNVSADQLGYVRIGDISSLAVNPRGSTGTWLSAAGTSSGSEPAIHIPDQINQPAATIPAAGVYATVVDTAANTYSEWATCLASLPTADATAVAVTLETGAHGGVRNLALTAGVTNVLTISSDELQTVGIVLTGAAPSATTPLVFNITKGTSTTVNIPTFEVANNTNASSPNTVAPYVVYNLSGWTGPVTISGNKVSGSIFAPGIAVTTAVNSPIEGQIVAGTLVTSGGEIHHYAFAGTLGCDGGGDTGGTVPASGDALKNVAYVTPASGDQAESNLLVIPTLTTNTATSATNNDSEASITIAASKFDLALRKTLTSFDGKKATFLIEVFNQGPGSVAKVDVTDYIDATVWKAFNATLNPAGTAGASTGGAYTSPATLPTFAWTAGANPVATITGAIADNESVTIPITLELLPPDPLVAAAVNRAEISALYNSSNVALVDEDSTPDNTATNDKGGLLGSPADDAIDGTGIDGAGAVNDGVAATDEDDADPASVPLYDLALTKKLTAGQPTVIKPSANPTQVSFDIEVTNQGATTAYSIAVTDTPPAGTSFVSVTGATGTAPTFTIASLAPGATTVVTVVYELTSFPANLNVNLAEISAFDNNDSTTDAVPAYVKDIDSTPDTNAANDKGGLPGSPADDAITGNGTGAVNDGVAATDEDDADPATYTIPYDLALRKRIDATQANIADGVTAAEKVTFLIEVFNQGADVNGITVTDYIQPGWSYVPADNATCTPTAGSYGAPSPMPTCTFGTTAVPSTGGSTTVTINGAFGGGSSVIIPIVLTADPAAAGGALLTNKAEISAFDNDANGATAFTGTDVDSTPDATDGDTLIDDTIDSAVGGTPSDEDDHDIAYLPWWDLALVKTSGAYMLDASTATPTAVFTVKVRNQGPSTAYDVKILDTAPAGTVISAVTPPAGTTCGTTGGTTIECTIAELAAATDVTITVTIQINDKTVGTYENLAEITAMKGILDPAVTTPVTVSDVDSTPDADTANDVLFENTADANDYPRNSHNDTEFITGVDSINEVNPADEDDHDAQAVTFPLAVGDFVWFDLNHNGIQDDGETGVKGAEVLLLNADGSPALDADGNEVVAVFTDEFGFYHFGNLAPGDYKVSISHNQADYLWTVADSTAATDATDSDVSDADTAAATAETAVFTLANGEPNVEPNTVAGVNGSHIDPTLDAGIWLPVALSGTVWFDRNHDGLQDEVATYPVEGVTASLLMEDPANVGSYIPATDADGNPVAPLPTDEFGNYSFDNLLPGSYKVQFSTFPVGDEPTLANVVGTDTTDSDADVTGLTAAVTLSPTNRLDTTLDLGLFHTVSVGDLVWYDADRDGIYEPATESGLEGVTVKLLDSAGLPVTTDANGDPIVADITDVDGRYSFTNLLPGNYKVEFTLPDGYLWTMPLVGADLTLNSDAEAVADDSPTATTGLKSVDVVAADSDAAGLDLTNPTVDAGVWIPLAVGDYVWYDTDHDGVQDASEAPVVGAKVRLMAANGTDPATDANGDPVLETTTNANGFYVFDNLLPGDYVIEFEHGQAGFIWTTTDSLNGTDLTDSDATYTAASDAIATTAVTLAFDATNVVKVADNPVDYSPEHATLVATYIDPTNDAGIWMPLAVGNRVWNDINADGQQGNPVDEPGVGGVTITLLNADGTPAVDADGNPATAITEPDGSWVIDNLLPGEYKIIASTLPEGYNPTNPLQGPDRANDSNVDPDTLESGPFTLAPTGGNMVPNTDENVVAAMIDPTIDLGLFRSVSLGDLVWYDADRDGIFEPATETGVEGVTVTLLDANGDPVATDAFGEPIIPIQTDADGRYSFSGLASGEYIVEFTLPDGYQWTKQNQTADTLDSDVSDANPVAPTAQTALTTVDDTAAVIDTDPSDPARRVTDPSLDAGIWFPLAIGDYVWFDLNRDGIEDATEDPVVGAEVTLLQADGVTPAKDADGVDVVAAITDSNGLYVFDNLLPGTYVVKFDHNQPGYEWTNPDAATPGTDATDSDAIDNGDGTAQTAVITLAFDAANVVLVADNAVTYSTPVTALYIDPTNDAGIWMPVAFGDTIWNDVNKDGQQGDVATEPGIDGVTVTLLNADGTPATDADGNPVAPVVTADGGKYVFDNLLPGDYKIKLSTLPQSYQPTEQNVGADATDSDVSRATLESDVFTLSVDGANMDPNTDPLVDGFMIDPTIDAGLFLSVEVGDLVWYDANRDGIFDPGTEKGVEGVKVELLDENGALVTLDADGGAITAATTDENGRYWFPNLIAGDYAVRFTLPDGYQWTKANVETLGDTLDSDAVFDMTTDPTAETGSKFVTNVTPVTDIDDSASRRTATDPSFDAGIWFPLAVGDYVWLDENRNGVQDAGEAPVEGATVALTLANGDPAMHSDGVTPVAPVDTNAEGLYVFDDLLPGDYIITFEHKVLGARWTEPLPEIFSDVTNSDAIFTAATDATASTAVTLAFDGVNSRPTTAADDTTYETTFKAEYIDPTNDAGIWAPLAMGDYIWNDVNMDGQQGDPTLEPPVAGVTVTLLNADGSPALDADDQPVPDAITDENGLYYFGNLLPGTYTIKLSTLPEGYDPTTQNAGDDTTDSDVDPVTLISDEFTLSFDGANMVTNTDETLAGILIDPTIDAGLFRPVSLGDVVWYDANRDGDYDATEIPLAGVTVRLLIADPDQAGEYIAPKDASGVAVEPTSTDDDGRYSFENLISGDYIVEFVLPTGYSWTKTDQGTDDGLDSDVTGAGNSITGATARTPMTYVSDAAPVTDTDTDATARVVTDPTLDAGVWLPLAIGDYVWFDLDHDGFQDPTEDPVVGAKVELFAADGTTAVMHADGTTPVASTTTNANGLYVFDNLLPGSYVVKFTHNQPGYEWTAPNSTLSGATDTTDSDAVANLDGTAQTVAITLAFDAANVIKVADNTVSYSPEHTTLVATYIDPTNDAGIWMPLAVGDYVWNDVNNDGQQGDLAVEPPVKDVTVTLYLADGTTIATDADGAEVAPVKTDANGYYVFDNLVPGDYRIKFSTLPEGYDMTKPLTGATATDSNPDVTGLTPVFTLSIGGTNMVANTDETIDGFMIDPTIDAGIFRAVSLGDLVWYDVDRDGIYEPATEDGLEGVTVALLKGDGTPMLDGTTPMTTTTDADGRYSFTGLPSGEYIVKFTLPSGAEWTKSNVAAAGDFLDSDVPDTNPTAPTAQTPATLVSDVAPKVDGDTEATHRAVTDPSLDAGVWFPMAIGDYVWYDLDHDGVQDATEKPVVGATVELFAADGTTPATDADGIAVATATTDDNGLYVFDKLLEGTYVVKFTHNQTGYQWTAPNDTDATDATDSDPLGAPADASSSTAVVTLSIDPAVSPNVRPTTVEDDTTYDTTLRASYIDPTNDAGIWMPLAVGDFVWYDVDHDGKQDEGELPVEGVTVKLFDANGVLVDETATNVDGWYVFDGLPEGDYSIEFSNLPLGWSPTRQDNVTGDDVNDSDADSTTGLTDTFTLTASDAAGNMEPNADTALNATLIDPTVDMGVFQAASLGDLVWYDANRDGIYDPKTETPIAGVKVELLKKNDAGTFEPAKDADNALIEFDTTDADGRYSFMNLAGGTYQVVFHLPTGYEWTKANTPGDDSLDSDVTFTSGTQATAKSGEVYVDHFTAATDNDPDGLTLNDPTIDAGVWLPMAIGDYVWFDLDRDGIQDATEEPVVGATVELLTVALGEVKDADGMVVGSTTTDENGLYVFDNLLPGSYVVRFTHAQTGYQWTVANSGAADDQTDSDATFAAVTDATAKTEPITLADGALNTRAVTAADETTYGELRATRIDPTNDAGIWMPVAVADIIWFDADHDGVQDDGETPVEGVTVTLTDAAGNPVKDASGADVAPFVTLADGLYVFDNLLPGDYKITFSTLPEGAIPTLQAAGDDTSVDSNPDPATLMTPVFTLAPTGGNMVVNTDEAIVASMIDPTIDMGIWIPLAIGDIVWYDVDHNGLQDEGEDLIPGVTVTLLDADGNPALDADGNEVAAVTTDENGHYVFDNLIAGDYKVLFEAPEGFIPTLQAAGDDDAVDSNPDTTGMTPVFTLTADGTLVRPVEAGDGTDVASKIDPTIDAGFWVPLAIGDYVWYDLDNDGVQKDGEKPVEGVKVELLDADGNPAVDADGEPVAAVITDANGHYVFDNLISGDYSVKFSELPAGYTFTEQAASGDEATDSNPDATGVTPVFTLSISETNMRDIADTDGTTVAAMIDPTIDAGIWIPMAIGNYVWFDANVDGIQGADEEPIENVKVELLDADGNVLATTLTDEDGWYVFDGLPVGEYKLRFSGWPGDYELTKTGEGDDTNDSNPDPTTGETELFTLTPDGVNMRDVEQADGTTVAAMIDPTFDAGIFQPLAVGTKVWIDTDKDGVQDANEPGVPGVKVELFNEDGSPVIDAYGNPVGPLTTDENGNYLFDNLLPGKYFIKFTAPSGYTFTGQMVSAGQVVGDSNPGTTGQTPVFELKPTAPNMAPGAATDPTQHIVNLTIDAGLVKIGTTGGGTGGSLVTSGTTTTPIVLLGLGLLGAGGLFVLTNRRRRKTSVNTEA